MSKFDDDLKDFAERMVSMSPEEFREWLKSIGVEFEIEDWYSDPSIF